MDRTSRLGLVLGLVWLVITPGCSLICPDCPASDVVPPAESSDTGGSEDGILMTQTLVYGAGGLFVQIDVDDLSPTGDVTSEGHVNAWTGVGNAPAYSSSDPTPAGAPGISSPIDVDFASRRWGGGVVQHYTAGTDTKVWVYVELKRKKTDGTYASRYFSHTFTIADSPVTWLDAAALN